MSVLSMENQVNARTAVINDHSEAFLGAKTDVSEKEAAALTFYDNGMIRSCNSEITDLLNCLPSELTGQHITRLLPQLKEIKLLKDNKLNPYLQRLVYIGLALATIFIIYNGFLLVT